MKIVWGLPKILFDMFIKCGSCEIEWGFMLEIYIILLIKYGWFHKENGWCLLVL